MSDITCENCQHIIGVISVEDNGLIFCSITCNLEFASAKKGKEEKMSELANYLVHIYECDATCGRAGIQQDAMFMTFEEMSGSILAAHLEEN